MKKKLLWMALCVASAASAQTDCSWVIRLSQRTTTVIQDQSAFAAQASAFCQEYAHASASNSSTSVGVSYAGVVAVAAIQPIGAWASDHQSLVVAARSLRRIPGTFVAVHLKPGVLQKPVSVALAIVILSKPLA